MSRLGLAFVTLAGEHPRPVGCFVLGYERRAVPRADGTGKPHTYRLARVRVRGEDVARLVAVERLSWSRAARGSAGPHPHTPAHPPPDLRI